MAGFNQESYTYHEVKSARWDMINDNLPSLSQGTGAYENKEAFLNIEYVDCFIV